MIIFGLYEQEYLENYQLNILNIIILGQESQDQLNILNIIILGHESQAQSPN